MTTKSETTLARMGERMRSDARWKVATAILAAAAVLLVGWGLRQIGIAITTDRTPLSCAYSSTDAHMHDDSCYRNGFLVCPVPEKEEHRHSEGCYDDEGNLVCGLEETTGPHVHGPACFGQDPVDPPMEFEGQATMPDGAVVSVSAIAPPGALPAGTTMVVSPVDGASVEGQVRDEVSAAGDDVTIDGMEAVDISFVDADGNKVEPSSPISVTMTSPSVADGSTDTVVVHVSDAAEAETVDTLAIDEAQRLGLTGGDDQVSFVSESFSTYVLLSIRHSMTLESSDGVSYNIEVACPTDAGIPMNATLAAREIPVGTEEYEGYRSASEQAIGTPVAFARLFDITICDGDGTEIQPADGSPLGVSIWLDGLGRMPSEKAAETQVIHFGEQPETVEASTSEGTVTFAADGFSVYAVVNAASDAPLTGTVPDLATLAINCDAPMLVSANLATVSGNTYFKSSLNSNSAFETTTSASAAAEWNFEPVSDGSDGMYRIRTRVGDSDMYIRGTGGNNVGLTGNRDASATFVLSQPVPGKFVIKKSDENRWLQYSGSGKGFRLWTDAKNAANTRMTLTYASGEDIEDDPYGLDGKTYGIAYQEGATAAAALMPKAMQVGNASRLSALSMLVRPDILQRAGYLLVARDTDIAEWTFHNLSGATYNVTTQVDGETMYLSVDAGGARLLPEPDPVSSSITMSVGSGTSRGKYLLSANGYSLELVGGAAGNGFGGSSGASATAWLNLVEKSSRLADDNFTPYLARKVSASDTENLRDGMQVVLYTRVWNDETLHYDYYVVDYDGVLVQCYDRGDGIQWVGNKMNTALWQFTEYHNSDGTPNYYYELQNVYSKKYLAPQIRDGQILSDDTIGINLNGRRYGDDYTTIIAWDDPYYEYASFAIAGNALSSCSLAQGIDFYFAIVEQPEEDELTTAATVNNDDYGITMKMIDFNNKVVNERDSVQFPFFGSDQDVDGLLSTNLEADGYPLTTEVTGHVDSVGDMFTGMTPVNHLFLKDVYEESGYFEYDSTQNFAHLGDDGNFVVYDQLGCIGTSTRKTRTHGQFMPYNDLDPTIVAPVTNQTDVLTNPLPDVNSRKGEKLYMIPVAAADYFFGMEMEASFTQTESGLDAWGHDIIFEFSGDDDFWLYVDGELVLDLGGVHQAMAGSVNFRTGTIKRSGSDVNAAARSNDTTLYDAFRSNYEKRHPNATQAEVTEYLDGIFATNANGQRVFKDYTTHTMKVFYMERGSGASNLRMRFNLASATPNSVTLGKTISGTERSDYALAEFPYQIWYTRQADNEAQEHLLSETSGHDYNVTYAGKSVPVKHMVSYTPPGGTESYSDVFFLKPGQLATIKFPEDAVSYRIVECGIGTSVYDAVSANEVPLAGIATQNNGRKDYSTELVPIATQPRVIYNNHVSPEALRTLTITKRLYDADGTTLVHDDPTGFSFRLYLTSENDGLSYANMHPYFVRDPHGSYCTWDAASQGFVPTGKSEYDDLTEAEKIRCTFHTSPNGSISKIPADYSVEVRELVIGAQFQVIECDSELPPGYTRRETDGYVRLGGSYIADGEADNAGTIRDNSDPVIEVRNQRGWGLTARKAWSDDSFMSDHGPIYLAVYLHGADEPIEGTIRRLADGATSTYWYFDRLSAAGFDDYEVREVEISNASPEVSADGTVSDPGTVTPIPEGGSLSVSATSVEDGQEQEYEYEVGYGRGEVSGGAANVRTDMVSNSRPGIRIVKADWTWSPLAGARFSIRNEDGEVVGRAGYTSGEDGLVTVAYLPNGNYTLTEDVSPTGFRGLAAPLSMTVSRAGNSVVVAGRGQDAEAYEVTREEGMPTVRIRNRALAIAIAKEDTRGNALAGATFAIHRKAMGTDGLPMPSDEPVNGWEELTSGEDGTVHTGLQALGAGEYYLLETAAPEGYLPLSEDVTFAIGKSGEVTVGDAECVSLEEAAGEDGTYRVTITVQDEPRVWVRLMKVDVSNTSLPLAEARFDLFRLADDGSRERPALMPGMESGDDGMLSYRGQTTFELSPGRYEMVETRAPSGYVMRTEPIVVTVEGGVVGYEEGTGLSHNGQGASYDPTANVWLVKVSNSSGYALPRTAGAGTRIAYIVGSTMAAVSVPFVVSAWRRRGAGGNAASALGKGETSE